MKRIISLILLVIALLPATASAQENKKHKKEDRKEWMNKLKALKKDYLIKELNLTDAQKDEFFKVYDEMEAERHAAEQKVRHAERTVRKKGDSATNEDYDAAIAAQYRLNSELGRIESKYEPQLRKVLTKRQLFNLRGAEFGFQRKLMEHCPNPKHKEKK